MNDAGGWLWLIIDVGAVIVLGAVLAYGVLKAKHRRNDAVAPEYKENDRRQVGR